MHIWFAAALALAFSASPAPAQEPAQLSYKLGSQSWAPVNNAAIGASSAVLLAAARPGDQHWGRISITLKNNGSACAVAIGPSASVTFATGMQFAAGDIATIETQGAIYAIAQSGTCSMTGWETF